MYPPSASADWHLLDSFVSHHDTLNE